jgi:hypothetical protein
MPDYKTPQLSYYYSHRAERSAYARAYYIAKKQNIDKKTRRKYKTWKSNMDKINEHKQYIIDNQIKSITISFFN